MMTSTLRDRQLIEALVAHTRLKPTAMAAKAGVSASTLTRVANGSSRLSVETIEKLQQTFPDFFGDLDGVRDADLSEYVEIEVLPSYAGMGGGGFGDGEPGRALFPRQLVVERLRAQPQDLLVIDVRGDSMTKEDGTGFLHGDQVLVDRRDRDPSQPGPFALWDGDAYVLKLVERVPLQRGKLRVFAANKAYSAYEVDEQEARLIGRPVWYARNL